MRILLKTWLVGMALSLAANAFALKKMYACETLLIDALPEVESFIDQKRNLFAPIIVTRVDGRITSTADLSNPEYAFDLATGAKYNVPPKEELHLPYAPIEESINTLVRTFPLLSTGPDQLEKPDPKNHRESQYHFQNSTSAFTLFNDYSYALEQSYRQLLVACEALRTLIKEQKTKPVSPSSLARKLGSLETKFKQVEAHTLSLEQAMIHQLALNAATFSPYPEIESLITPENVNALASTNNMNAYFKTFFLSELVREEVELLKRDLNPASP